VQASFPSGTHVIEVAPGRAHTCARASDGRVWCWGQNAWGQLGTGNGLLSYGGSATPVESLMKGATGIAAGAIDTCAIRVDGTVWCWGHNGYGELGNGLGPTNSASNEPVLALLPPVAVGLAAGNYHSCAIRIDGSLWCWGLNGAGQVGDGTYDNSRFQPVQSLFHY
jgi:hypothetical protein